MTRNESAGGARDEAELLAEEFVGRLRRGERPTIEEYVAAHPALESRIRELFTTLLFVEELGVSATGVRPETARHLEGRQTPRPPELQQVGEYRILREIGRGGMGIVYEAEQESLGRRVALKVLPFHFLLDSKRLERFQQEARAAARLSHPNIVPVYGVGEHLGLHYYAMQLIPGQGLNRVIEEVRRQRRAGANEPARPESRDSSTSLAAGLEAGSTTSGRGSYFRNVARLARDAALALDYAHGEGILHRDVKPSNLLLDPGGRVWLTDFGLAKAEGTDELTHSGDFVGTVLYMAPERFKGWSDPRSDVYGLGITLHELLTLRPAFVERDRAQLVRKVAGEEPSPPRRLDRSIPRDLETIVLKSIAKEPSLRYASARAMAEDLGRFLEGLPVEARRSNMLARLGRWGLRNPLLSVFAATILLLLVAVAVVSSTMAARLYSEQKAGQAQLRASFLAEASALRASARTGRRFEALEALRKAAEIRPGADLVDEALACLALVDVRHVKTWLFGEEQAVLLSPDGSRRALAMPGGEIVIQAAEDNEELYQLPSPGFRPGQTDLTFSHSGKLLAARQLRGTRCEWRIWSLDRRMVCAEVKDGGDTNGVDFAPDDTWGVLVPKDRTMRIVDLATGAAVEQLGTGYTVDDVAVHPGGRLLAFSSSRPRGVNVLDREGGQILIRLTGADNLPFPQVAWHPDGKTLAAACMDHLVYVWNAETGERRRVLQAHWAQAIEVSFSPDGGLLASAGWDPAVRLWDAVTNRPILSIPHLHGTFSADSRTFSTIGIDRMERWELASRLPVFTLFGHDRMAPNGLVAKHPSVVALAPDGRLAASGGDDGVRLWDLRSRQELCSFDCGKVYSVCFDPAGKSLYVSGSLGVHRWPLRALESRGAEGRTRLVVGPGRRLTAVEGWQKMSIGNGGRTIGIIHERTHAHIFDPDLPDHVAILYGPSSEWSSLEVSADGAWVAAGTTAGGEVWIWNLRSPPAGGAESGGKALAAPRQLPVPSAGVLFHPASTHLLTGTPREWTMWRLSDLESAWKIDREPAERFRGEMAFSEDGKILAVTHNSSRIWLVDSATGAKLSEVERPDAIRIGSLSLVGGRLAACSPARRINVWDLSWLARDVASLGLEWRLSPPGPPLEQLPALRASAVEDSRDLLRDEVVDLAPRRLFRPHRRVAYLPELSSFTEIDLALATPTISILEGEEWRYFRGRAEPSNGLAWTLAAHDDSRWETGKSPFSARNRGQNAEGTVLNDQVESYTTLYLRHVFTVSDPTKVARLVLAVEIEDGFVAYLNGEEIGRFNAGSPGERLSRRAVARRTLRPRVVEPVEAGPSLLQAGKNVLALQVLSYGLDSYLHALPVLALVPVPDPERDRRRTSTLFVAGDGNPEASLLAYRDGRILQRAGDAAGALAKLELASQLDREAAEPLLRRLACHRTLGEMLRTEALCREAIEQGEIVDDGRLWRAWLETQLVDLKRPPAEALASLPADRRVGASSPASPAADARWLLEELAAGRPLRINCGGGDHESKDGKRWSRDRYFLAGSAPEGKAPPGDARGAEPGDNKALFGMERWFAGSGLIHAYSIPLPAGRYRVSLHFVEATHRLPGERVFDIHLEGRMVQGGYDTLPAVLTLVDVRTFEVDVTDGALDLDFLPHQDQPRIAALEVESIAK